MSPTPAKRRRVTAPGVHESEPGLSSNCFVVGDFVVLNGLTARDADGMVVGLGDPYAQAVAVFRRMQALMAAAGGAMGDIIKMTCYLVDIRHREAFVRARREFFTGDFPPCVVVGGVAFTVPEMLIEVEAWAILGCGE